jgi:hypothetical protein
MVMRAQTRVGQVLKEKWRLDVLLGVGGMAAVRGDPSQWQAPRAPAGNTQACTVRARAGRQCRRVT